MPEFVRARATLYHVPQDTGCMTPLKLIIDCDPGVDDAVALLLAFASHEALDILGITTVTGNSALALTARNARLIRRIANRPDVPVYTGAATPLERDPVEAGDFHGPSGLGPIAIVEPDAPLAEGHAAQFIADTIRREPPNTVTLAVTGPATNIALALRLAPEIGPRVKQIVVMGGARSAGGNITASAEYNVYADPHAFQEMLQAGCPIAIFGLDVTYQVLTLPERIDTLEAIDTPSAQAAAQIMRFCNNIEADRTRRDGAPLHDPCTIAYLLRPDLFTLRPAFVQVETHNGVAFGHTAVEFRVTPEQANAQWATSADGAGVFALINQKLAL